jgi:hypothetical protein
MHSGHRRAGGLLVAVLAACSQTEDVAAPTPPVPVTPRESPIVALEAARIPPLEDVTAFLTAMPLLGPFMGTPVEPPALDPAPPVAAPSLPAFAALSRPLTAPDTGPSLQRSDRGMPLGRAPLTLATFVQPPELGASRQEVDWFQSGPYVGGLLGMAALGVSDGSFEDDLSSLAANTSANLDQADFAWRAFGGWRFDAPFSIELGYSHLGRADSTIAANVANLQDFLDDVVATQPFLGRGIDVQGRWWMVDTDRFDVGLGAGLWYWTAEIEATAASGESASDTQTGLDLLLGLDALFRVLDRLDVRVGLEHYRIEDEGATAGWIGLQGRVF